MVQVVDDVNEVVPNKPKRNYKKRAESKPRRPRRRIPKVVTQKYSGKDLYLSPSSGEDDDNDKTKKKPGKSNLVSELIKFKKWLRENSDKESDDESESDKSDESDSFRKKQRGKKTTYESSCDESSEEDRKRSYRKRKQSSRKRRNKVKTPKSSTTPTESNMPQHPTPPLLHSVSVPFRVGVRF